MLDKDQTKQNLDDPSAGVVVKNCYLVVLTCCQLEEKREIRSLLLLPTILFSVQKDGNFGSQGGISGDTSPFHQWCCSCSPVVHFLYTK